MLIFICLVKGLAEEWWRTHNTDPDYGLKEIIELLFHSTGWKSYTFQNTLDEGAIRKYIKRKVNFHYIYIVRMVLPAIIIIAI